MDDQKNIVAADDGIDRLLVMTIVRGSPNGIPTREVAYLLRRDVMYAYAVLKQVEGEGYVRYDPEPGPFHEDLWYPLQTQPGAFHHAERLRQQYQERGRDSYIRRIAHADQPGTFEDGELEVKGFVASAAKIMECMAFPRETEAAVPVPVPRSETAPGGGPDQGCPLRGAGRGHPDHSQTPRPAAGGRQTP